MRKLRLPLLLLSFLVLNALLSMRFLPTAYEIGEDYRIEFSSENPSGSFSGLQGSIHFDDADLAGSFFDVQVDAKTINTGNGIKNKHAMGKGYFDVDQFPTIAFRSATISKAAEGYTVLGILNMKGMEREIEFPFDFVEENGRKVFKGGFEINRRAYGIGPEAEKPSHIIKVDLFVPVSAK